MAAIVDLIKTGKAPFDLQTMKNPNLEPNVKWIGSPVTEIWPFEIQHITREHLGPQFWDGQVVGARVIERTTAVSYRLSIVTITPSLTIRPLIMRLYMGFL